MAKDIFRDKLNIKEFFEINLGDRTDDLKYQYNQLFTKYSRGEEILKTYNNKNVPNELSGNLSEFGLFIAKYKNENNLPYNQELSQEQRDKFFKEVFAIQDEVIKERNQKRSNSFEKNAHDTSNDRVNKKDNDFVLSEFEKNITDNDLLKNRPQMKLLLKKALDNFKELNDSLSVFKNIKSNDLTKYFNNMAFSKNKKGNYIYQGYHEEMKIKGSVNFDMKDLLEGKLINEKKNNTVIDRNDEVLNKFEKNINKNDMLKDRPQMKLLLKKTIEEFKDANYVMDSNVVVKTNDVMNHFLKKVGEKNKKGNYLYQGYHEEMDMKGSVKFDIKDLLEGRLNNLEKNIDNKNIVDKNDEILCEFESNIRKSDLLKERPQMKMLLNKVIDNFKEANFDLDKGITSNDIMNHFIKLAAEKNENGFPVYNGYHMEMEKTGAVSFNMKDLLEGRLNNEIKPLENTTLSNAQQIELAKKTGYIQGVCECVAAVGSDYTLGKKLLSEMNVNIDTAKKFANPETFKKLEQGIFSQKEEHKIEQKQSFKL